jgi:large subunit ribosomal protein L10
LNREQKAAVIDQVAAQISESEAIFAIDYRGISVPQAAELRTRLRDADASFRVVKNRLTERAADQAGADALKAFLEGPTAMTFVRGDAAVAAKALSDFRRTTGGLLGFKGGWMNGDTLTAEQIDAISRLPSRDVLYGRLVGMVASPLTGLVMSLNGLIGGLARQLQQVADQGLVGGEGAPAEAAAPAEAEAAEAEASADAAPVGAAEAESAVEAAPADAAPAETATEEAPAETAPEEAGDTPSTDTETQED